MHDIFQHVGMAARGNRFKEITGHIRQEAGATFGGGAPWCARDNGWLIEDHDGRPRPSVDDRGAEDTVTAPYVDDGWVLREVVRRDHGSRILRCHVALVIIEDRRRILFRVEKAEQRLAVDVVEGRSACHDTVKEFSACLPPPPRPIQYGPCSATDGHILSHVLC